MSLRRHSSYRKSGTQWLAKLPSSWQEKRLRHVVRIQKRIAGELGHQVLSITQKGIRIKDTESNEGQLSQDYSKYQLVEPCDYAMNHMDLLTGYIDQSQVYGVTSPDYRVFTLREGAHVNEKYLLRVLQNAYLQRIFYAYGQGSSQLGRWRLPTDGFLDFVIPVPPLDEQAAVANFLDRETAKIDALIAEQQRLIELLQEKKQAVISHAVTKGLNPNAPMKDSRVEWLGEVPEHWRIGKLKHICDVRDGTHETPSYLEPSVDSRPLVTSKDIGEEGINLEACSHISLHDHMQISRRSKVDKGDLLMPMIGSIGGCQVVESDEEFSIKNVALFKIRNATYGLWLKALINSDFIEVQFDLMSSGGVQAFVSLGTLRNLTVPIIPMSEQQEIVYWLDTACAPFTDLVHKAESTVSLLKERRSALISAAVTGQIDVRGLVESEVGEQ